VASLRQQLEALIDELSPTLEKAFLEAIEGIKSEIILREIVERLERRDIEGAIDALHIDPEAFRPLSDALRQAYNAGGLLTSENMPRLFDPMGGRVVFRWDVSNQAAEANIRDLSSTMITNIADDTRTMVRERILAGYAQGQGPNTIATSIAGRIDKVTRKRVDGALGITAQLGRTVENARLALSTGDVEGMKAYLLLKRRDKRFDRTVMAAIRAGKPLSAENVAKVTTALTNRYILLRGQTVARTETAMAVMNAKHQAYLQALAKANRDTSLVTRKWRSAGDRRVRHTHAVLNAQEVTGMDMPFQSPSGAILRFPGDTSLGAGAGEVVNCRCDVSYIFNFAESYARSRGR